MHQVIAVGQGAGGGGGSATGGYTVGTTTNNSGNSTITPTSGDHLQIVNVGGSARTSVFILDTAGRVTGDKLKLRFNNPATASIVEEIRNATVGGTLLYSYTTDGTGEDEMVIEVYFDGSAWSRLDNAVPVI